jgi:succinate dehydrogenase hydrophobic anchor subunit
MKDQGPMQSGSRRGMLVWALQAISGVLLVAAIALHWFAQHLVVEGGLRDYSQVVSYLREPFVLVLETSFLVVVSTHALLGLRAIVMDLGPVKPVERLVNLTLGLAGIGVVVYGIRLTLELTR